MQDDLIERLRTQADAMMFNDCLEPCTMREAADAGEVDNARIAALEADNARLMGLVKEAGEALSNLAEAYVSNVDPCRVGGFYSDPETDDEVIEARATLAKIKEATDA